MTVPPAASIFWRADFETACALTRSATLDAGKLHVSASKGTVTIKGHVRSWPEHDDAIAAAWAAPGVKHVHDQILVDYDL